MLFQPAPLLLWLNAAKQCFHVKSEESISFPVCVHEECGTLHSEKSLDWRGNDGSSRCVKAALKALSQEELVKGSGHQALGP